MHASIAEFPSKELYSSALISHESVASRRLIDLPSILDKDSEDAQCVLEPTLVFFDTAGTEMYERLEGDEVDSSVNKTSVGEGSRYNENEAEIVSKWVRQLVSTKRAKIRGRLLIQFLRLLMEYLKQRSPSSRPIKLRWHISLHSCATTFRDSSAVRLMECKDRKER
jgi:superfamily I DNA and/or RNA helicase